VALIDSVASIKLAGLPSGQAVTLRATSTDSHGNTWESYGDFVAGPGGVIDLQKDAPTTGTYAGIDQMGLFWSMVRKSAAEGAQSGSQPDPGRAATAGTRKSFEIEFVLMIEGKAVAASKCTRLYMSPDVKTTDVRENGLVATLYEPAKRGPHAGIIVLGGSEGGIRSAQTTAAILASHGYAALAVAYFGMEGLPERLAGIRLEYIKNAIDWMGKREGVDAGRLAVLGGSKGAELALLAASYYPEIKAVVAYVPTNVAWPGIGGPGSSWTYQEKPVPFVPYNGAPVRNPADGGKTMMLTPLYQKSLDNREAVENAAIAVEKINGPVLLISGKDDQLWPSALMGELIIERLKQKKHRFRYEHLSYYGAGHAVRIPYNPTTGSVAGGSLVLGGTPHANARAQADSWPRVLRFLSEMK
jgi:dienelactone hydrolase